MKIRFSKRATLGSRGRPVFLDQPRDASSFSVINSFSSSSPCRSALNLHCFTQACSPQFLYSSHSTQDDLWQMGWGGGGSTQNFVLNLIDFVLFLVE